MREIFGKSTVEKIGFSRFLGFCSSHQIYIFIISNYLAFLTENLKYIALKFGSSSKGAGNRVFYEAVTRQIFFFADIIPPPPLLLLYFGLRALKQLNIWKSLNMIFAWLFNDTETFNQNGRKCVSGAFEIWKCSWGTHITLLVSPTSNCFCILLACII